MFPLPAGLTNGCDKRRLDAPPAGARAFIDKKSPDWTFPVTIEEVSKGCDEPDTIELPLSKPKNTLLAPGLNILF